MSIKKFVLSLLLVCQVGQSMEPLIPVLEEEKSESIAEVEHSLVEIPHPSCLKTSLDSLRSGLFAVGMMTVYTQSLKKMDISLEEAIYPFMATTGFFYALKEFFGSRFEEKNKTPFLWKLYSGMNALIPTAFLLDAEVSHHRVSGNEGWDNYFTYFMAVAPWVLWAEYANTNRVGQRYFLTITGETIRALEERSDEDIEEIYQTMEARGYYLPIPSLEISQKKTESCFATALKIGLPIALPLLNMPFSFVVYNNLLNDLVGEDFKEKETITSCITTFLILSSFLVEREILRKETFTRSHLTGILPAIFEAFPFIARGFFISSDWNPFLHYPSLLFFSFLKILSYDVSATHLIQSLLGRSPCYKGTSKETRIRLHEKLQEKFKEDL